MSLDVSMCRDALRKTFSKYAGVDILKAIICERDPESCRNSNNYLPLYGVSADVADICL